ncbi:MAG: hypothetical protein NT045_08615 [Candidatus Aureabacteria bacterium]|nr:hypothetical protein [Candidatus Auribacterota bacterium]
MKAWIVMAALAAAGAAWGGEPAPEAQAPREKSVPESYSHQAGKKLARGGTNMARSVTEFYVQPMEAKRASGKSISMLWPGMGEGMGMFLTRVFGGMLEVVSFAVPFPNGWQPLLDE